MNRGNNYNNNYYENYKDKKNIKYKGNFVSHFNKYLPFYCEICDRKFNSKKSLNEHCKEKIH